MELVVRSVASMASMVRVPVRMKKNHTAAPASASTSTTASTVGSHLVIFLRLRGLSAPLSRGRSSSWGSREREEA